MKKIITVSLGSMLLAANCFADTANRDFTVSATVNKSCNIGAISNLGFAEPSMDEDVPGNTSITITCTKRTPVNIGLSNGNSSSTRLREMVYTDKEGHTHILNYNLYQPDISTSTSGVNTFTCASVPTDVWGNTDANKVTYKASGIVNPDAVQICGILPKGQDIPAGTYSDTITATINF